MFYITSKIKMENNVITKKCPIGYITRIEQFSACHRLHSFVFYMNYKLEICNQYNRISI